MLIVIPVSLSDLKLLDPMLDAMEHFGGLRNHSILFVPAPSVLGDVSLKATRLRSGCPNVAVEALPREPHGGWPVACNMHFRDTVDMLEKRQNALPWFWMEPDTTPIRGGWADQLETEYNRNGALFMGVIRDVKEVLFKNGIPVDDGRYMVGVGIYPPNFKSYCGLYQHVGVPGSEKNPPVPFDVRQRWEVNPMARPAHHTNLIAHHPRTGNYQSQDGILKGEDLEERPEGRKPNGGSVAYGALVVHGCKDGSLARLVLGQAQGQQTETKMAQKAPESKVEPILTTISAEKQFQILCDTLAIPAELRESKWKMLTTPAATDLTKSKLQTEQEEQERELDEDSGVGKPALSMKSLQEYMEKAGAPVEVGTIAADFGAKKGIVSMLANNPKSGLKLNGNLVEPAMVPA
jgi:hypothetical protein